ncbi:MAG: WcaI family glycosyltransferase [Sphingomonadaceae bacterium]|nr:WcaI family glycosyltransferase [Sphingomonadaceae bacterium]
MKILILGLNYAPEPIGIGPYTAGLAESLAASGHEVRAIVGNPYYPDWKLAVSFAPPGGESLEQGVQVTRVRHYIPANPSGIKRIIHHLSFGLFALRPARRAAREFRPDMVFTIAPSLLAAPVALHAARKAGAASWLHIQDFEVEAALATGLLSSGPMARLAGWVERAIISRFDRVSTISQPMLAKARAKGAVETHSLELRNWAEAEGVGPHIDGSTLRAELGLPDGQIALYSGNLALKQGVGLIAEAARELKSREKLHFVVCGDGSGRAMLEEQAAGLDNLHLRPLQPRDRLGELLAIADIHLLPQIADAADLVLPSKLTNMLASGRPVVATAAPDTALAAEVDGCGLITPPGDAASFARAVATLADDETQRDRLGQMAANRAQERWSKQRLLAKYASALQEAAGAD